MSVDFTDWWTSHFPDCPPVGHVLRRRYSAHWSRVYSLTGGRRYPESEADTQELLRRQNEIMTVIAGTGVACFAAALVHGAPADAILGLKPVDATSLLQRWHESFGETLERAKLLAATLTWEPHRYDDLLLAVAEDRTGPLLFAVIDSGHVIAPYDGGIDLIIRSREAMREFHGRFSNWLADTELGL